MIIVTTEAVPGYVTTGLVGNGLVCARSIDRDEERAHSIADYALTLMAKGADALVGYRCQITQLKTGAMSVTVMATAVTTAEK